MHVLCAVLDDQLIGSFIFEGGFYTTAVPTIFAGGIAPTFGGRAFE
jgi:hypothetical protein